jgi:hypothetical protein
MCAWQVQAQEREVEDKDDIFSKVRIDTIQIKATPYERVLENGVWKDEDKPIDYYNDITIYEISKKESGQASLLMTGPKPTIFMLPGGAFLTLVDKEVNQMDPNNSSIDQTVAMGYLLTQAPYNYNVFIINYLTGGGSPHSHVAFPVKRSTLSQNCLNVQNETGRSRLLEASYKAFHDFRKILINNFLNNPTYNGTIDINNIFLVGSSAGSVLALNALFLQQSEIPSQISYLRTCAGATSNIGISPQVRNDFWNLPQFKGVFTMAGAWIYDDLSDLTDSTPASSLNTAIYMLHGTCDEIIHRKVGSIGYKFAYDNFILTQVKYNEKNNYPVNRYINGQGSEAIFNLFKSIHNKITYGQVYKGGHGVFWDQPIAPNNLGAWDVYTGSNTPNPVFNQVANFVSRLVANPNDWETRAFVLDKTVIPEAPTTKCASFDQFNDTICFRKVYPPTISYTNFICDDNTYTAVLGNLYSPATYNWTSSGNVQIIGATNGTSVQYKRISSTGGSGSLSVTISRPCAVSQTFTFSVSNTVNLGQGWTLNAGPLGISNQCGVKFASLPTETIPPNSTTIFSINVTNAALLGIASMEWEFNCGTIISGPTHVWSGNNLYSEITVMTGPIGSPCTNVRVRPVSTCGTTGSWRSQNLSLFACSGGMGMMIHPNPGTTQVTIELTNAPEDQKKQTYPLELVDLFGMVMFKTEISDGKVDLDISQFKSGQYKVIIRTSERPIYSNFNISR